MNCPDTCRICDTSGYDRCPQKSKSEYEDNINELREAVQRNKFKRPAIWHSPLR